MVGSTLDAFLNGVVAGYGIAIPVGPIAILILELGLRRGFRIALSAGAGAASADLIYADGSRPRGGTNNLSSSAIRIHLAHRKRDRLGRYGCVAAVPPKR